MALFIKDINYITMDGSLEVQKGSIRIDGRRITEIGRDLNPKWGDEIIYGHDKLALPGFINGHTHGGMSVFRGFGYGLALQDWLAAVRKAEERLNQEDLYWFNLFSHLEMMKNGITTFADMYYNSSSVIEAMEESGIRCLLSEGLLDDDGRGEVYLRDALRIIDSCSNDLQGRLSFALAPHAGYTCSAPYLQWVAAEAKTRDIPLHIHIAETVWEQETCLNKTGKRVVNYLDDLGVLDGKVFAAHMVHLDEGELDIIRNKNVAVIHCPVSNAKLASGVMNFPALRQKGITVGIGTDGVASNNNYDIIEEVRTAALLQKAIRGDASLFTPDDAVSMLTCDGAKAIYMDDKIGRLKPGMLADITIMSLWRPGFYPRTDINDVKDHLLFAASGNDVHTVIVNGEVLISGGRSKKLDEGQIYHEVQRRAAKYR